MIRATLIAFSLIFSVSVYGQNSDRRSGSEQLNERVTTFDDALRIYWDTVGRIQKIAVHPMLTSDSRIYKGLVKIEAQQDKNTLRTISATPEIALDTESNKFRVINTSDYSDSDKINYVFLRTNSSTLNFATENMSIGRYIGVIGKYVGNLSYRTVSRTERVGPLIEVLYIGLPEEHDGY